MKWWQTGLLIACLTMLIVFCGGLAAGTFWYYRTTELAGLFDDLSSVVQTPDEASQSDETNDNVSQSNQISDEALNRVVVLGTDGNVFTISPEGENRIEVTNNASQSRIYRYPTWSPDGNMIAFVEISRQNEGLVSTLHVVSSNGDTMQQIPTEFPPFYLFWGPTSEKLTFLSNWENGMALRMVDIAAGAKEAVTVQEGMPFYFSWEPTGNTMLAHIGGDLLTFLDLSGEQTPLDIVTGPFQAPHWSADGKKLAFVSEGEKNNEYVLNVTNAKGEELRTLAGRRGAFSFNWSPDNQRIAYSYSQRSIGLGAFGPLWVHDTVTHQAWEISKAPVVAFFWSPDGKRLAFLRPEAHEPVERAPEAAPLRQEQFWLRWHIWDGERTYPLVVFSPSESFLTDYLRYFDQYAQSISIWSPDSQMLLYTGLSERGLSGVWALPVEKGSLERRIASGIQATWSPR